MPSAVRMFALAPLLALGAALAGCGSGVRTAATVTTIDRTCEIIESVTRQVDDPRGGEVKLEAKEMTSKTGECRSVAEWEEVRSKRNKMVDGTAAIHVSYRAPDGSYQTGTVEFTGRDDEFYELKAGDQLDIMVDAKDPERIWKA